MRALSWERERAALPVARGQLRHALPCAGRAGPCLARGHSPRAVCGTSEKCPPSTGTAHQPGHGREPAVLVANVVCEEQPRNCVLPLLAAGSVAAILMPDASDCMGKRKKKGTEEADEMYEVDQIVARRLVKGAPEYLVRWKGYDEEE